VLDNLAANWPYLILMGLAAGTLSGLVGIGGGVIMVPMLIRLAMAEQHEAQGMSLAYMIITALVGFFSYKYRFDVRLDYRAVALLTVGGVIGALVGSWGANHINAFWLRKIFAVLMVVIAAKMILERPKPKELNPETGQAVAASVLSENTPGDEK